jgi:hypothetical protein
LPKKPKPAADEAAINKLVINEPATKSTTLKSTDDPAIIKPNIIELPGTLREDIGRQGTNKVIV